MASISELVADLFERTPPFDALTDDERRALREKTTLEIYAPGDIILSQGEDVHRALYIVESGLVRLTDEQADRLVNMVGPGATFGSYGLLQGGALPFEARAAEETTCALVAADAFEALRKRNEAFATFFADDLARYVRQLDGETDAQGAFLLFDTRLDAVLGHDVVAVEAETPIREAARAMAAAEDDTVVVTREGAPVGLVTEGDFVEKVVAGDATPQDPVISLVERPPVALRASARLFDAVRVMMAHRIRRIVVTQPDGALRGVLTADDIAHVRGLDPVATTERLERAPSVASLASIRLESNRRLGRLALQGVQAEDLLAVVSEVDDQLKRRLLQLVEADLREDWGEARPGDVSELAWAWLAFGAGGRREGALNSALDNGLVYADPAGEAEAAHAAAYFAELAERSVDALARCGFEDAASGVTAAREAFRQPLARWRAAYGQWAEAADAEATARAAVCFDFRVLYGDDALGDALREAIQAHLPSERLVHILARPAVGADMPLGLFGGFDLDTDPETGREGLDLRRGVLVPIAQMARAMAIELGDAASVTTLERLRHAAASDHPAAAEARALVPAFSTVADLHLREQMAHAERGERPSDRLDPDRLHKSTQNLLKETLKSVADVQKRLRKTLGL